MDSEFTPQGIMPSEGHILIIIGKGPQKVPLAELQHFYRPANFIYIHISNIFQVNQPNLKYFSAL